ncbi:unnamed protein product [Peronospora destructor]|uniref:Uncharacterized protein n=1 Tax=Peronospora destructor TaxID=86335 RepID=A0AAV0V2C3_9STRA|nr:unnamed protein product [Peronospora destructor]
MTSGSAHRLMQQTAWMEILPTAQHLEALCSSFGNDHTEWQTSSHVEIVSTDECRSLDASTECPRPMTSGSAHRLMQQTAWMEILPTAQHLEALCSSFGNDHTEWQTSSHVEIVSTDECRSLDASTECPRPMTCGSAHRLMQQTAWMEILPTAQHLEALCSSFGNDHTEWQTSSHVEIVSTDECRSLDASTECPRPMTSGSAHRLMQQTAWMEILPTAQHLEALCSSFGNDHTEWQTSSHVEIVSTDECRSLDASTECPRPMTSGSAHRLMQQTAWMEILPTAQHLEALCSSFGNDHTEWQTSSHVEIVSTDECRSLDASTECPRPMTSGGAHRLS